MTEKLKCKCEICGLEFYAANTKEDAIKEKEHIFPKAKLENCILICDNCFPIYMQYYRELN